MNFFVIKKKCIISSLFFCGILLVICIAGFNNIRSIIVTSGKGKLLPVYSVETKKKHVAITFDCAWGASDISDIVTTLQSNNVTATFFTVGDWVKKYPDEVRLLHNSNMLIRKSYF